MGTNIGAHLATLNLFREADGRVYITVADGTGAIAEQRAQGMTCLPIEYVEGLIYQAATTTLGGDRSERDRVLEECAEICEGVTHWGLSPTKATVAKSTQAFCAKAIRAQIGAAPVRGQARTYTCTSGRGDQCTCYACHGG